jgi:hypothetical protein
MKTLRHISSALLGLSFAVSSQAAVDPACNSVITSSLAHAAAPAWESVTVITKGNFKMESIRVGGQAYMRIDGKGWKKSPVNFAEAEKKVVDQIINGTIKLSNCKDGGDASIEGVPTRNIHYTVEMPGAPATSSSLYVGKSDGLPYAQMNDQMKSHFRYRGVTAPKL